MFRGDHEFRDDAMPSHLGHGTRPMPANDDVTAETEANSEPIAEAIAVVDLPTAAIAAVATTEASPPLAIVWDKDAEKELGKIPFFVRGKARRNTERFATEHHIATITIETLYDAKAHYSR
jgi:light-independent protochlorophyllide reductase subunit B